MIGIISCGIMLLITIVLRITLGSLTDKFGFLESWLPYINYIAVGFAVATVIFIVIAIIKAIRKK